MLQHDFYSKYQTSASIQPRTILPKFLWDEGSTGPVSTAQFSDPSESGAIGLFSSLVHPRTAAMHPRGLAKMNPAAWPPLNAREHTVFLFHFFSCGGPPCAAWQVSSGRRRNDSFMSAKKEENDEKKQKQTNKRNMTSRNETHFIWSFLEADRCK